MTRLFLLVTHIIQKKPATYSKHYLLVQFFPHRGTLPLMKSISDYQT
jgi:hypothetical protein